MMQIHEKFNLTPFNADIGFCHEQDGMECAVAVLKATYNFDADGTVTQPDRNEMLPVFIQDEFYKNPDDSGIKYPSDIVPIKHGTDVVIIGNAYGKNKNKIPAGFSIGKFSKTLTVCGHRVIKKSMLKNTLIGPFPFEKVPLIYENAYGGSYSDKNDNIRHYVYNPVGMGFSDNKEQSVTLPLIQYPGDNMKALSEIKNPAGFGAIPPGWKQRYKFAGTFDDKWAKLRRPLFPEDFDENFYNTVPEDQIYRKDLTGGEIIILQNLHIEKELVKIKMPEGDYAATFRVKGVKKTIPMKTDTLLIEPDENRFTITYRATLPINNNIRFLNSIHFTKNSEEHII